MRERESGREEKEQGRDSETLCGTSDRWQCLDSLHVGCHCRKIDVCMCAHVCLYVRFVFVTDLRNRRHRQIQLLM